MYPDLPLVRAGIESSIFGFTDEPDFEEVKGPAHTARIPDISAAAREIQLSTFGMSAHLMNQYGAPGFLVQAHDAAVLKTKDPPLGSIPSRGTMRASP